MNMIPPITVVTADLHSCTIAEPSATDTGETQYSGAWSAGTLYHVDDIVLVAASHLLYVCLLQNTGFTPGGAGNDAYWLVYRYTEAWLPFDGKVTLQAASAAAGTDIVYELHPGEAIDSMALLNIEAETVVVERRHGTFGGAAAETWTEDCYDDTNELYVSDIVKTNFGTDADPYFTITIHNSLATAKVGEIVIGNKESIGSTLYTPTVGIIDYSVKEVDTFGNYTVLERAYSKRLTCTTRIQNTALDLTYNTLATYRAIPVVWVGSEDYASMIVYGFYKDFSIVLSYKTYSLCELEVEGLV